MKKIIALIVCLMLLCTFFVSCGNKAIFSYGEFSFTHIHFTDAIGGHCATIEKWWDNESGIEVRTTEFGPMFCSEGSYMLFGSGDKCPYCH